jgi:DTW domain-containing protein YfiP
MPPLPFVKNVEFIIYMHNLELYNAGDDAKILLSAAPDRTSLFVFGREGDDERLRKLLLGDNGTGPHNTLLLFPDDTAISAAAAKATHLCYAEDPAGPPLRIMLLDGTWKQVKTMLKHLAKIALSPETHVKLSPETLSVYARKQSQLDRICTIEALALFLQECGEGAAACDGLIGYLHINNAALRPVAAGR